jgi:glycosyltransferase involved in cell wall biosynthesis
MDNNPTRFVCNFCLILCVEGKIIYHIFSKAGNHDEFLVCDYSKFFLEPTGEYGENNMKILVVQESNWIDRGPHQAHHLMERLAVQGNEIRIIDFDIIWRSRNDRKTLSRRSIFHPIPKVIQDSHITIIRPAILQVPILEYISLLYTHQKEIRRQLNEFAPDIVIGFGILNAALAASICHKKGIPFVYYVIDELHKLVPQRYFQRIASFIESSTYKKADLILSINEALREYTVSMGAPEAKTRIVRAGVDINWFSHSDRKKKREELGFHKNDIVLFFMGWLYEFSGLVEVSQALAEKKLDPRVKLLVVGKGDLWDYLNTMKNGSGMDGKIVTVGWQPYHTIPDFLAASDICVLPARNNGIMKNIVPIKLYEYMAAAKPVIARNLSGVRKEFGTDHGIFYFDDIAGFIRDIDGLKDRRIRKEWGEKARQYVEYNDWASVTDDFSIILAQSVHFYRYDRNELSPARQGVKTQGLFAAYRDKP